MPSVEIDVRGFLEREFIWYWGVWDELMKETNDVARKLLKATSFDSRSRATRTNAEDNRNIRTKITTLNSRKFTLSCRNYVIYISGWTPGNSAVIVEETKTLAALINRPKRHLQLHLEMEYSSILSKQVFTLKLRSC